MGFAQTQQGFASLHPSSAFGFAGESEGYEGVQKAQIQSPARQHPESTKEPPMSRPKKNNAPPRADERQPTATDIISSAVRALDRRYPQLRSGSSYTWSTGATVVFSSRAERDKAKANGLIPLIEADLRELVAQEGGDPETLLRTISYADMDEIKAAGGEYYFYK